MMRLAHAAMSVALVALPLRALAAHPPARTFTVVSGEVRLRGDEQVCFSLTDTDFASDRILVKLRFSGSVPRGSVTLDGARSESFRNQNEEIAFTVEPRGVHRLALDIDGGARVDQLTITSTETTIVQESCANYDFDQERTVRLEAPRDEPTNVFETPEERAARDRTPPVASGTAPAPSASSGSASRGGVVPAGSVLSLTLQGAIDTRSAYAGQVFTTYLDHDVTVDGRVVIPEGSRIEGHVIESKDAGRFGRSSLKLGFDRLHLGDGRTASVAASVERIGKGSAAKQGGIIAGSAVGGAILGKVLGGSDKDALLGAIVGGAIAAGSIGAKENEPIVLPAGTALTVRTDGIIDVPPAGSRR